MTPKFKVSWFLCFALSMSLNCWAFEEGNSSNREMLWQEFMNQGKLHRQQWRFAEAEKDFLAAVSAAQQFGSEDPRYAASLNALGTTYHDEGRYAEAEHSYREALKIWETASAPENEIMATCLNNLARLLQDQGQFAKAEPLLKRALAIEEKLLGTGHLEQAKSLDHLGDLYFAQGLYRQAETIYRKSLAVREKLLNPDHLEIAISLNSLAQLHARLSEFTE